MHAIAPGQIRKVVGYSLIALMLITTVALVLSFFNQWPIENTTLAIDWRGLWNGVKNGQVSYSTGMFISPWSVPFVLPFGFLSFRSSWGLLTLLTFGILVLSVPTTSRRSPPWLSILILVTSFPALRHAADGNFEGLIIAGVVLAVVGNRHQNPLILALGVLMASAKLQETWILLGVLGLYILTTWPLRKQIILGLILVVVVVPCMLWIGQVWLNAMFGIYERGSIVDISLIATLTRLGLSSVMIVICWLITLIVTLYFSFSGPRLLSREKAGMLICASLALAPYAAGNSLLTVLAVGLIPLFQKKAGVALPFLIIIDVQYLLPRDLILDWGATVTTLFMVLTLIIW